MARRDDLIAEIAREEQQLTELCSGTERCKARIAALREEMALSPSGKTKVLLQAALGLKSEIPTSNAHKIALFRSLFHGREDVFPRRWQNPRTGKSGYSPACANEWKPGICEKKRAPGDGRPRATCGECPNQAFLSVTDEEVAKHLRGLQIMGVYPLLSAETCWFLAADFDKKSWLDDVAAFAETCKVYDIPVVIERSRSGNGAHAWFFFAAPVSAAAARKIGCFLITETMTRRHQLSMESYDRLFPNQDTMPKGGFGNLIALPLQRVAREHGNSVFLDASFMPYEDQWAFLANVRRIDPADVQAIADEATRQGQVIGVRMSGIEDEDELRPWSRLPSGRQHQTRLTEPVPSEIRAVLSQRLFIEKAGLPSPLLNQLKRLAAFQNPEFYQKQNMRLSTALTPRVIACAEELVEHVALPRGCLSDAETLLKEHGASLVLEDKREAGKPLSFKFQGTLTPMQKQAAKALLAHDTGVFVAPPGVGKTVVGINVVAARGRNALVIVHRKPLLDQWVAQLALFLGVEAGKIGQIGAGKRRPNGQLDVAMIQSLVRKGQVDDIVAGYGHVIVDECHHLPAVSFERVLSEVKARYVTGLTATPQRRDGHHPITQMQLGPVRFAITPQNQAARRPFEHRLIVRETSFRLSEALQDAGIQAIYAALAVDQQRNDLIFNDIVQALKERHSPIVLTERRDHLECFAERLRKLTRHLIVLHGGMKSAGRREALAQISSIPPGVERVVLATGRYIGEGFDDARLDTLFLALPISWKGTLVQYTGRLHRLHPGKAEVRIYDYVDREVPVLLKMFQKRLRGYRAIGYGCAETLFGLKTNS